DAGVEKVARLDGEVLAAQNVTDQVIGVPDTAPVRRVQVLGPDVSLGVYPGRDGRLQRGFVFLLLFRLHLEKLLTSDDPGHERPPKPISAARQSLREP